MRDFGGTGVNRNKPKDVHKPNEESDEGASFPSTPARSWMPEWYPDLLASVVERVSAGRRRAVLAANQELVATYWAIGQELLQREAMEGWGAKVVLRLSEDIRERIPGARGFSPRNLRYMKSFADAWARLRNVADTVCNIDLESSHPPDRKALGNIHQTLVCHSSRCWRMVQESS